MEDGRTVSTSTTPADSSESTISIFVKVPSGETIPFTLPTSTSIPTLIQLLSLRTSLPTTTLRLTHSGKQLYKPFTTTSTSAATSSEEDAPTLASLSLEPEATLTLAHPIRSSGGPKKIRCSTKDCGRVAQRIVGDCGFCGGHFCGNHRMLEDHKCSGLEDCKNQSREQNRIKLESERTVMVRGI